MCVCVRVCVCIYVYVYVSYIYTCMYVCMYVCVCVCIYTHTSDCVEIVYELSLLPNNTANETLLQKSEAVRSADWIFIIGAPAWLRLCE